MLTSSLVSAVRPLARAHELLFIVLGNETDDGRFVWRRLIGWRLDRVPDLDAALEEMQAAAVVCLDPPAIEVVALPDFASRVWMADLLEAADKFARNLFGPACAALARHMYEVN